MTLLFPDAATLRLVVGTDGLIPADVLLAPATTSADAGGRTAVETDAKLTRKQLADLAALGVSGSRRHLGETHAVTCWPQLLPAEKLAAPPALSTAAPVLFELAATDLPELAGELLRLGNDRQQLLTLSDGRALLRVVGPPYYTLLRALDDPAGTVRAFAEAAPRVWVQVGYTHPFAALLKPADGQMLLVGPSAGWDTVPDGPFRDIYEALDIELPAARVDWQAVEDDTKLTVPLTLTASGGTDAAELWVLRGESAGRTLDEFAREADSRLLGRLKFAIADAPDGRLIVLRTTAGRQAPPAVALPNAVGFRPFSRLPNLYLPVGRRLAPTLRRDAVRELLADDPDRLVWLYPGDGRKFVPESVPEASFRPLAEWVEYVISEHHEPLAEWVAATTFAFESFVCGDTDRPKPTKPADDAPKARKPGGKPLAAKPALVAESPLDHSFVAESVVSAPVTAPTVEWREKRDALEKRFLAVDGPLDHPDRTALWPQLAVANAGAGEPGEAAICWLNAAWAGDPSASAGWLAAEGKVDGTLFDAADPTPGEARRAIALFLADPGKLPLPVVQKFLAANEATLPARSVWLAALTLAERSGADALGLARVRDRLLGRMLEEGLNPERDLPAFLRFAGLTDSDRVRLVRAGAAQLHDEVRRWCAVGLDKGGEAADRTATLGYVDLLFAFGLARLGDTAAAEQLVTTARRTLDGVTTAGARAAAGWLFDGYAYRVSQAAAGKAHAGVLPADLMARLEVLRAKAVPGGQGQSDEQLVAYAIDRQRHTSRVLEPVEKLDPYRVQKRHAGQLHDALLGLERLAEPAVLARRVRELYDGGPDGRPTPTSRSLVLEAAVPLAHRVGEAFTLELIDRLADLVATAPPADAAGCETYGHLLERGLFLAGFYDRREEVQRLVELFVKTARGRTDDQRFTLVNTVAVPALRSLRRLGLREEIDKLAGRLPEVAFGSQPVAGVPARYLGKPATLGLAVPAALAVAAGWNLVGLADRAAPVLADAEGLLTGPAADKLSALHYPRAVQAYLAAAGFGPPDVGLQRLTRLFTAMREPRLAGRVLNTRSSSPILSVFHLAVAEDAVLAASGDEFALGDAGRRWLEEDEQIVRRRLHRDMARALERGL